jgi:hypothetical protein
MDDRGRVLSGRRIDVPKTAKLYAQFYKVSKTQKRKGLLNFVDYFNGQAAAGRVPIDISRPGAADFAAHFGSHAPKGSKIVMVPRRFAGKELNLKGKVPVLRGRTTDTYIHFLDFITEEWLEELQDYEEEAVEDMLDFIKSEVSKFVMRLPSPAIYSITLATGDYAKGSTFNKAKLIDFLADLILRFVKSKGVQELKDFAVAVNALVKRKARKRA